MQEDAILDLLHPLYVFVAALSMIYLHSKNELVGPLYSAFGQTKGGELRILYRIMDAKTAYITADWERV